MEYSEVGEVSVFISRQLTHLSSYYYSSSDRWSSYSHRSRWRRVPVPMSTQQPLQARTDLTALTYQLAEWLTDVPTNLLTCLLCTHVHTHSRVYSLTDVPACACTRSLATLPTNYLRTTPATVTGGALLLAAALYFAS